MVPITDDTFKYICLNENDCILIRTLLKFVTTTRVQIMMSHGIEQATLYNRRIIDLCTQICCNNGA